MAQNSGRLGFWSIVLLGMNAIIGSGIFLLPGKVTEHTGIWSLGVYVVVSLIVMAIVWCFAQCAMLFTRNGGAYIYAREAFGEFIGFEVGMMRWVVGIIGWAAMVMGFITALSVIWPQALDAPVRQLLVLGIIISLSFLNILGVDLFKWVNNCVTSIKLFLLILFMVIGSFLIQKAHFTSFDITVFESSAFGSAALVLFYAYSGFECVVVAAGEMEDPRKNLPKAVLLTIILCALFYCSIQIIAMGVLGDQLGASSAPLADAADYAFGLKGKWFVVVAMLFSIGGINLSASFLTPRSAEALADDGLLPRFMAKKGHFGTPTYAIGVTALGSGLLALQGSFVELAVISVIARFCQYIATCLAVFVFDRRRATPLSTAERWVHYLVPSLALLGIFGLMCYATLVQLFAGLGALILGVPIYGFCYYERKKCGEK